MPQITLTNNWYWAWTLDVILIALVSKVTLLVWLSNFAQCALPCAHLNPIHSTDSLAWAPNTVQNLKVTPKEWLLKLTLFALHQIFRPTSTNRYITYYRYVILPNKTYWVVSGLLLAIWCSISLFTQKYDYSKVYTTPKMDNDE